MQIPSMQELLEAGVHFGHQVRRWNPKMSPFIFGERSGVHVIDLAQTVTKLAEAADFVKKIGAVGGKVIFVSSKNQAKDIILTEAQRCGANFLVESWIGGLLTNWEQITKNIKKLTDLKTKKEEGEFKNRTKKENLLIDREIAKLSRFYGGLVGLEKLPEAIFVVDVKREENACREAQKKNVPVVAICDTNANLTLVDWPIPGNDDAIRAIEIVTKVMADAFEEGREEYNKKTPKEKVEAT